MKNNVSPKHRPQPASSLPPSLRDRPPSYIELLHQGSAEAQERDADPMWRAARATAMHAQLDRPLHDPLAELLAHTLASGRDRISNRELFWRLRIQPHREACERRAIARVLRSLGWVRTRWGTQGERIWGWRWREWNTGSVKLDLQSPVLKPLRRIGVDPERWVYDAPVPVAVRLCDPAILRSLDPKVARAFGILIPACMRGRPDPS